MRIHPFVLFLSALFIFIPFTLQAEEAGFAPSSGIFFSEQDFLEGTPIKIYTLVVNNKYTRLQGEVGFFVNERGVGTVSVGPLKIEEAVQLARVWTATYGDNTVTARFVKLEVEETDGTVRKLGDPGFKAPAAASVNYFVDRDSDGDGIPNREDSDDDNDGLSDEEEAKIGSSPIIADTDKDSLSDKDEVNRGLNPIKSDTDGDGTMDSQDLFPTDSSESKDSDKDGIGDNADPDDDNNGLNDDEEKRLADPRMASEKPLQKDDSVSANPVADRTGRTNQEEIVADTNPLEKSEVVVLSAATGTQGVAPVLPENDEEAGDETFLKRVTKALIATGLLSLGLALLFGWLWHNKKKKLAS